MRRHRLIAALAYIVITLLLGRDVVAHLNDSVIGPAAGDNLWFVWSLWVFKHNVEMGRHPGHTDLIFAFLPSVQIFTDAFFNQALAWPLQSILSPLGAYNLTILLSFVLGGWTMYLLAYEFVRSPWACFAAGCFYNFSTYHFARADGHLGLLTLQWLPFCAWRVFVLFRRPSVPNAVLAGVGLALVPLSEIYFLPYFLLPFVALFLIGKLLTPEGRAWIQRPRHLLLGGLAALTAALIAAPALLDYLIVDPDVRETAQTMAQGGSYSADLLAFFLPPPSNPIFGNSTLPVYEAIHTIYPVEQSVFLGYPALVLGLGAIVFRRNRTRAAVFWLGLGMSGFVLALGNQLSVAGQPIMPLPFHRLAFGWPYLSTFRAPNRLAIVPLLALSLLSAYTIEAILARFRRNRVVSVVLHGCIVALLGLSLAGHAIHTVGLAIAPVPVSPLYREIAADRSDVLLLDLPLNQYVLPSLYQYYQTIHGKDLVDGNAPRVTPRMRGSLQRIPQVSLFDAAARGNVSETPPTDIFPQPGGFRQGLEDNNVGYVVLHSAIAPGMYATLYRFLEDQLGTPFYEDRHEGLAAWRVPQVAPAMGYRWQIDSGWLGAPVEVGGITLRATTDSAQVRIFAPQAEERRLRFAAAPYFKTRTLRVKLNGVELTTVQLPNGKMSDVDVGVLRLQAGENTLQLEAVDGCSRPGEFDPANTDPRCFGFAVQRFRLSPP